MMTPADFTIGLSGALTLYGVGLWLWSWVGKCPPVIRMRYQDCGVVIVFASTLALYAVREREWNIWDWILVFLGPVFISAALWRLFRTQIFIKPD
ncbi:hypothetical protein OB03_03710 [Brevundimonas sp. GN22]